MRRVGLTARGAVQGVGFRPTVYRLAAGLGLGGWIRNDPAGVELEVEGPPERVEEFLQRLPRELPTHAVVRRWERRELTAVGDGEFRIHASGHGGPTTVLVLPDLATCPDCLRELRDPADRRHRYPFLNCTLCGPRYTIVRDLPYDRARTTMAGFPMCARCRAEYDDPRDRRFHAQPTACPECGPQLRVPGGAVGEEALGLAGQALRRGEIVALKGLGGFQLLVDARSSGAVQRLRERKRRHEKPLAVMAPDLGWVTAGCRVAPDEERLLTSSVAPIVLLRARRPQVAPEVAPGCARLGVMLPYTPLHHLLLGDLGFPVVATSGNLSEEPLCIDDDEALQRLGGIADLFLLHDRPIERPVDDSVAWVVAGQEAVLRRARGYAPMALPAADAPPLLAVGGHQKGAVAITVGGEVVVGQHLGDLDGELSRANFRRVAADLARMFRVEPQAVACDLHPDYASTAHAGGLGLPVVAVQHHAAHVYSLMLDAGLAGPVLGVAWDGTGFGPDGTIWGGEFLRVDAVGWERVDHLRTFRLPGGEAAVREPRRSALGVLHALGAPLPEGLFTPAEARVLQRMLDRGVSSPVTSSAGRLFDAVSALVGLRLRNGFEGQAAMELEAAATGPAEPYPFDGTDWGPALLALLEDPAPVGVRSARFHETMAALITAVAVRVGEEHVALTGGCFQNALLTERCVARLREAGFRVHWHRSLPTNDGGLSAGQAYAVVLRGGHERCALPSPAGCSR